MQSTSVLVAVNTVVVATLALAVALRLRRAQRRVAEQSRALEAAWAERRELEQLLHDGAQTRLSALTMRLGAARSRSDTQVGQVLAETQTQLGLALGELRELAHGIHSMTLTESGLGVALESAASRHGMPVRVTVPPGRFSPAAEALAYYVVCWVLTEYIRAAEGVVDVTATREGERLRLQVAGRRGAPVVSSAEALNSSIALRVRAVGGTLSFADSPSGLLTVDVLVPSR